MEYSNTIIFYGILTSILMSALILISLYINPRIWMHDLPKEVQKTIPEKIRNGEEANTGCPYFIYHNPACNSCHSGD